jgi:hypothetical protein
LLGIFGACFTKPTFDTFTGLVTGLIGQTRRRTVCGMLLGAGLEHHWHRLEVHRQDRLGGTLHEYQHAA